jgi:hypothetical protein
MRGGRRWACGRALGLATGLALQLPELVPTAAVLGGRAALAQPGPMNSPWWENYDVRQRFLCPQQGTVVVERNDSQASLFAAGMRFTLFRERDGEPGLRYRNDNLRLILNGDELTLEQLPQRFTCTRTEEV